MSVLLRSFCKIQQHLVLAYNNNSHKSLLKSTVRWKSISADAFKSQRVQKKKEPVEVFKWILLAIPVTSFGLGCWQMYRLQWKINLIDMLHAKSNSPPSEMPSDFSVLEEMEYKPVKVRGKFVHEKEMLIGPRAMIDESSGMSRVGSLVSDPKKNQGWLVVTPFMLADTGEVILVNRGWIHQSMKPKEKHEPSHINKEVELVGVVRLTEKRAPFMPKNHPEKGSWFYRDLEQMSSYLGCQPVWLDARGIQDPPEGWPIPNQTRVTMRNEHLSYIITWEGNHPDDYSRVTYRKLLDLVCQFGNALRDCGVGRGDRVGIYMPMILETVIAMLACARIGAVHTVVFAGFSSDSLAERLADCKAKLIVTADGAWRGEKMLYLKNTVDEAIRKCKAKFNHSVALCICVSHLGRVTPGYDQAPDETPVYDWDDEHDIWWHELMEEQSVICPPAWVGAEDPLFMLYTSGSTGKPKGVLHTTAGYLMYASATFRYVFDYRDSDVYWCTADVGWITGHTYTVYAPLVNAATSVLFEGTPFYPDPDRYWEVIHKYKVSQFYTAPTAIRSLMKYGEDYVTRHDLSTLRVLGSVGEPINPEAWQWYYNAVGGGRASIVDTFWQTETGGHVLTSLPGATPMKPGAAGFPFFGVEPKILDETGKEIEGAGEGYLVFSRPWPGMMRTLYNDHDRYEKVYFSKFPGYYCTGDGARRDEEGFLWVTGRIDDMLNVSGHLMSTSEVESVLTEHPQVSEAAVVSRPHAVKGESLYCFVTLAEGVPFSDGLVDSLKKLVRRRIGAFAAPDVVQHAMGLPKTRSGKIMRRLLRKVALGERDVGDTSTLADPGVIDELFKTRPI